MPWVEVFAVFVVCHVAGDFLLQTEFQATNKHGGLGRDPVKRRALGAHILTYTLCYVPIFVALADEVSALGLVAVVLAVALPHAVQDDGRVMRWWMQNVKHTEPVRGTLAICVDQSFHLLTLLLVALAAGG